RVAPAPGSSSSGSSNLHPFSTLLCKSKASRSILRAAAGATKAAGGAQQPSGSRGGVVARAAREAPRRPARPTQLGEGRSQGLQLGKGEESACACAPVCEAESARGDSLGSGRRRGQGNGGAAPPPSPRLYRGRPGLPSAPHHGLARSWDGPR
ncbi:uncharacterized protein LOC144579125, partial [Callithrix jacchus]